MPIKDKKTKPRKDVYSNPIDAVSSIAQSEPSPETTRSKIAKIYVIGYLLIISGVLIGGFYKNSSVDENKDILLAISGILSGPLGFIIGYYFKASKD